MTATGEPFHKSIINLDLTFEKDNKHTDYKMKNESN